MKDTSTPLKTTFTISPRKAGIFLGILAVVMSALAITFDLLILHFSSGREGEGATWLWPIARQFNFVEEANLANFYQGTQLLLAGVILFIIWRATKKCGGPHTGRWLALGCIFVFLGCDEVAQIHETTIALTIAEFRGAEHGKTGWFWVYLPLLTAFVAAYVPLLLRLSRRIAVLITVSGAVYVGGAVGVEKFVNWFAQTYGDNTVGYVFLDNLGEFMESTGIVLFIYALLAHLAEHQAEVSFRISGDTGRA